MHRQTASTALERAHASLLCYEIKRLAELWSVVVSMLRNSPQRSSPNFTLLVCLLCIIVPIRGVPLHQSQSIEFLKYKQISRAIRLL